jgi:hypothetical protein
MENAADALKIAFAIFVLITALTITFLLISQAKSTADSVMFYSDKTNFYEYKASESENREVPVTEVISALHRYYKESISVTIVLGNGADDTRTFDLTNLYLGTATIQQDLEKYIADNLQNLPLETVFIEEFVEVPINGKYQSGEDGTEITLTEGGKKVYVTYTLQ